MLQSGDTVRQLWLVQDSDSLVTLTSSCLLLPCELELLQTVSTLLIK